LCSPATAYLIPLSERTWSIPSLDGETIHQPLPSPEEWPPRDTRLQP
uniref:Uncharacterized protein n=1 Tax=Aegilops tauschii subsp. strangulata TaxID=200361 RepID=A0A452ZAR6_AEGTS